MEQIGLAAARVVEGVVKRHMRVEELMKGHACPSPLQVQSKEAHHGGKQNT